MFFNHFHGNVHEELSTPDLHLICSYKKKGKSGVSIKKKKKKKICIIAVQVLICFDY